MTARVYATFQDYQAWSNDTFTTEARVNYLLARASEVIDIALVGAVYSVDPNGYPTDANVQDVLNRATCAQVAFEVDQDDDTGVKGRLDQVTVGGLSFHRAAGTTALALPPLAPRAAAILRTSGVLPSAPMINW